MPTIAPQDLFTRSVDSLQVTQLGPAANRGQIALLSGNPGRALIVFAHSMWKSTSIVNPPYAVHEGTPIQVVGSNGVPFSLEIDPTGKNLIVNGLNINDFFIGADVVWYDPAAMKKP